MNIRTLVLAFAAVLIFGGLIGLYRSLHPYDATFDTVRAVDAETAAEPGTKTIEIRADHGGWQAIGKGPLAVNAVGKINFGGHDAIPGKSDMIAPEESPAPGLPQGILLAKIGETGKPFKCGGACKISASGDIYLAINDSDYSDNSGIYIVTILKNSGRIK
jgi:hypothetical protein